MNRLWHSRQPSGPNQHQERDRQTDKQTDTVKYFITDEISFLNLYSFRICGNMEINVNRGGENNLEKNL